eukprot:sb/3469740/
MNPSTSSDHTGRIERPPVTFRGTTNPIRFDGNLSPRSNLLRAVRATRGNLVSRFSAASTSLDVVSLYTNCDMHTAVATAISRLEEQPVLLPSPLTPQTLRTLLLFCLDNAYFEFNGKFYKQTSGGVMGSPLIVTLAEIRTSQLEQHALDTFSDTLHSYRHFVDDGIGAARDADHANAFLNHINSLSSGLQYTIEHPKDGYLPCFDVLIHPDLSTSIYRKPTQ